MPELLQAEERMGQFFGTVRLALPNGIYRLEISLNHAAYRSFKKITFMRPFDSIPGVKYRYFVAGSRSQSSENATAQVGLRIESGRNGKQFMVEVPLDRRLASELATMGTTADELNAVIKVISRSKLSWVKRLDVDALLQAMRSATLN